MRKFIVPCALYIWAHVFKFVRIENISSSSVAAYSEYEQVNVYVNVAFAVRNNSPKVTISIEMWAGRFIKCRKHNIYLTNPFCVC